MEMEALEGDKNVGEDVVRVLVADDHVIVRQGLKKILAQTPDLVVADEARSGQDVLEKLRTGRWDVLVLEIPLPGPQGLALLRDIKAEHIRLPILVFSRYPEEQYAVMVFEAGAAGYLSKESAPEELITAIRKVARGGKYVSPAFMDKLVSDFGSDLERLRHQTLSERESQVFCMIAGGKRLTQIAQDLGLSVKTVSTHRARVLKKMRMKTNADLIQYALRTGLVKPVADEPSRTVDPRTRVGR